MKGAIILHDILSQYIIATFISSAPMHHLHCKCTQTGARFDYCPHALLIVF